VFFVALAKKNVSKGTGKNVDNKEFIAILKNIVIEYIAGVVKLADTQP
jgi:hypothetical protein